METFVVSGLVEDHCPDLHGPRFDSDGVKTGFRPGIIDFHPLDEELLELVEERFVKSGQILGIGFVEGLVGFRLADETAQVDVLALAL